MTDSLNITEKAAKQLRQLEIDSNNFLRISVVPGGCSGMTYQAVVDNNLTPFDTVLFDEDNIRIVSDNNSKEYLQGLDIDYSDDLIKSGFRFNNRNSVKSCACGSSFET